MLARSPRLAPFLAAVLCALPLPPQDPRADYQAGLASITVADLNEHLRHIAAPELEGRDTPSAGLSRAAEYIADRFIAMGLEPAPSVAPAPAPTGTEVESPAPETSEPRRKAYYRSYTHSLPEPEPEGCLLSLAVSGGDAKAFALGKDFVP